MAPEKHEMNKGLKTVLLEKVIFPEDHAQCDLFFKSSFV